ncbi:MAG: hypothetical protein ACJ780_21900 [Solirubrobacteraceae bacterium]
MAELALLHVASTREPLAVSDACLSRRRGAGTQVAHFLLRRLPPTVRRNTLAAQPPEWRVEPRRLHVKGWAGMRRGWGVALLLLVASVLSFGAWTASAKRVRVTDSPLPGSRFLGGNGVQANPAPGNRNFDWQGLQARHQVLHTADCPPGVASPCPAASDNIFAGGSKDDAPGEWSLTFQTNGGANPADANILDFYRAFHHGAGPPFLYLAFTREASTGTVFITFELNQVAETWNNGHADIPCRTTGDILIAFAPHGNVLDNIQVEEWITTAAARTSGCAARGGFETVPFTPNNLQAAFNDASIHNYLEPFSATAIDEGNFAEAAINLKSLLAGDQEGCSRFASVWMYSQSSSAGEPSQMKDYVAPTPWLVRTCKASPSLTSKASGAVSRQARARHHLLRHARLGAPLFDTATLSDGDSPTGTITFKVYGPNDPTCAGTPAAHLPAVPVSANGDYPSASFTPADPGIYRWQVTYSGDDNNHAAGPTPCGIASETVDVSPPPTPVQPTLSTVASKATVVGSPISDSAILGGGLDPTGTITFHVYGPDVPNCTTPAAPSSRVNVKGNGTYNSDQFTPTKPGTYRWVASYSGDSNNRSASTDCGDIGESVVVTSAPPLATPSLTSTASSGGPVGSTLHDTAHLSGGSTPTGTVTFTVYGPNSASCNTPAGPPSTVAVSGAGDYQSATFTPTAAGTYRWVASYSGDATNAAAATTCGDNAETVVASPAQTALRTVASPVVVRSGGAVGDSALLGGGMNPRGTITFRLYGPNDNACAAPPVFIGQVNVFGNGSYRSPRPTPAVPGTYRWVAKYSGDANNAGAATVCGDRGEMAVVRPVQVSQRPDERTKPKPKPKPTPPPPPRVTG